MKTVVRRILLPSAVATAFALAIFSPCPVSARRTKLQGSDHRSHSQEVRIFARAYSCEERNENSTEDHRDRP